MAGKVVWKTVVQLPMPVLMLLRQLLLKLLRKLSPDLAVTKTYVIKADWVLQPAFFMLADNFPILILIFGFLEIGQ